MAKFVIEHLQPNFSEAKVGDVVVNSRQHPVNIKEWANPEKNGYFPQSIPAGGEAVLGQNNFPVQLHVGMGETWTPEK